MLMMFRLCHTLVTLALLLVTDTPAVHADELLQKKETPAVEPQAAPPQLLDRIARFLRAPVVYVPLIAVGLIGLIFEIKHPGTTFPGAVAAVCFVLFFWAHSFVGEFTLLAILLFLLGLAFVGIEVFLVPGLGFSGVAGAVLMFAGLLVVTLEQWPSTQDAWTDVGGTLGGLAIGLVLAVVGALALRWSLPKLSILNRAAMKPPAAKADSAVPSALLNSGQLALLGAIGVAVTPLRPSGKAQFGEQFFDVVAEGDCVAPGGRVQIIAIEVARMVVKEV
jgi:membrane-bound ClpP family serine protease